ncbi:MAG: CRISPR-associated endonuclease Cas1 [Alkaliphilus sp.]
MKLVVNSRGAYISKLGECFRIKVDEKTNDISASKVQQIIITTSVALSTDALELAVENNIDVVFLKANGSPFGRVWHSKMGSISTIRRKQLKLQEHPLGIKFVIEWVIQKIDNQIDFITKLASNRRDERRDGAKDAVNKIIAEKNKILGFSKEKSINDIRGSIQGHEGIAGRVYFGILKELIHKQYEFNGRSKNPARDYFNCMLNYGYGIMYSNVERACILAGLDPYIGVLHVDNYNRTAFTFDLIEMYRIYIDQIVFKLCSQKKVKAVHFDDVEGGYYLNKEGKQLLVGAYNEEMEKKIKYKGRKIELQNIIQFDCHNIANRILKEVD